jgi:hypothetical protein
MVIAESLCTGTFSSGELDWTRTGRPEAPGQGIRNLKLQLQLLASSCSSVLYGRTSDSSAKSVQLESHTSLVLTAVFECLLPFAGQEVRARPFATRLSAAVSGHFLLVRAPRVLPLGEGEWE